MRIAIVGAGPSGLFAAQAALDRLPDAEVDILDRLPTPFGLLRYGVAPDHASIKSIATALARVFDSPRVRFLGLVELGRQVSLAELRDCYDAVVLAAGASEDRRLGVPGEDLSGSGSAREFVAWYSGHPDASPQRLDGVRTAVTVGVGNVAIDVARVLLKDAADLAPTDMPAAVLAELSAARIAEVWVVGRRGPEHASFTTPELRELLALPGIAVDVVGLAEVDEADLDRRTRANLAALRTAAAAAQPAAPRARLHLLFWHRPVRLEGEGRVARLVLERTVPAGAGAVSGTGEYREIEAELVLRAIGYRGVPLPGVPFDERTGTIPNAEGRVLGPDGRPRPGEYAVGWIKRGPIGVIGTNKADAVETVDHLVADLTAAGPRPRPRLDEALAARGVVPSTLADWQRIDAAEVGRGHAQGRDRSKIDAWHELLDLVRSGHPGGQASVADRPGTGDNPVGDNGGPPQ
jgi:ferredoxin--NADP+ reductase